MDDRNEGETAGTPRWVKISAAIALAVVVVAVSLIVTGRGAEHGPGRHLGDNAPASDTGNHRPPTGAHTPP